MSNSHIEKVSTTVKIPKDLYDEFKILNIKNKLSLQVFVEKCFYLYLANDETSSSFQEMVNKFDSSKVDNK